MEEWKALIMKRLADLQEDKRHILEMDERLARNSYISESERNLFRSVVASFDREIESLRFELILDEMLASDLPLEEFMKKFNH